MLAADPSASRRFRIRLRWELIDKANGTERSGEMELSCNLGTIQCNTEEEIKTFLGKCAKEGADDIWIYHRDDEHPCLVLLLNPSAACVHYFASATEHYQSAGNAADNGETEFFCAGENTAMPNYTVVPFSKAIECVIQFLHTAIRPTCIEWNAL